MQGFKRVVSKGKVYLYPRAAYPKPIALRAQDNLRRFVAELLRPAAARARAKGMTFNLLADDLGAMLARQSYRCAVSGIQFEFGARSRASFVRDPWRPSIDRRDATKGYTVENCRLVCVAANFALNEWGDDVLARLARGVVERLGNRTRKTAA